ncbi:hypothetical protein MCEMSEM23_02005 [Rhabdaerophilaceae bacterium]
MKSDNNSSVEYIFVDIGLIIGRNSYASGYLVDLGAEIHDFIMDVWAVSIDHLLEILPTGSSLWARPGSPRNDFVRIESSSLKFYRTSDIIGGIMVCDGTETLFDVHFVSMKPPETALASEQQAIEFAAAELKRNPDVSKDTLRAALGTKYLAAISDRRMNSWIWPEARARAGLDKRARAGRKPGKSKR